ncbi:MAG: tetratricopeptide repeat protein [Planctomycetota bacterium]|jgi:hypothetical protein
MNNELPIATLVLLAAVSGFSAPAHPRQNAEFTSAETTASPPDHTLDDGRMSSLWEDLADEDYEKACEAVAALVIAGDTGVRIISGYVDSIRAYADPAQIKRLIWDMTHDESGSAQQDFEALVRLGRLAEQPLRDALQKASDEKARTRLEECLQACAESFAASPQTRRLTRIMWTLQLIGTDHAHEVLNRLGIPEKPLRVWQLAGTTKIRRLEGENWAAACKARDNADMLRAEYESKNRAGPPNDIRAFVKVVVAYKEAIESFPMTEVAAYCCVRLAGFYQYTHNYQRKIRELAAVARAFAGTEQEAKALFDLALIYLQGHHNPAKAIPWFEAARDAFNRLLPEPTPTEAAEGSPADRLRAERKKEHLAQLRLKWQTAIQQGLDRCRQELAARAKADKTPWAEPVNGIQCRLRPDKLAFPAGKFPGFRADIQNVGSRELWVPDGGDVTEVCIDGRWYARAKKADGPHDPLHWLGPDCQHYDNRVVLGNYWKTKDTGNSPNLTPGFHTVRVAFLALARDAGADSSVHIESNTVDIQILP